MLENHRALKIKSRRNVTRARMSVSHDALILEGSIYFGRGYFGRVEEVSGYEKQWLKYILV